jgi:uncharacterized membrane protein
LTEENLSLLFERNREALDVLREVALVAEELDVGAVDLDLTLLTLDDVVVTAKVGEAPVLGNNDLLAAGELLHISIRVHSL